MKHIKTNTKENLLRLPQKKEKRSPKSLNSDEIFLVAKNRDLTKLAQLNSFAPNLRRATKFHNDFRR